MLLRRVARPLLAALFIQSGINTLRSPQGHVAAARPVLDAVAPAVDKVVEVAPIEQRPDDVTLVQIDAGVKVVAGSLLALGRVPRLAATALAASMVPTTLATHRFWEETDPARKAEQQTQFLKNAGLLGGLLIAAADTEGKPSLGWKGRRAAKAASAKLADLTDSTPDLGERLQGVGDRVSGTASDVSGKVSSAADGATSAVSGIAAGLLGAGPAAGAAVSARASSLTDELGKRAAKARKKAEKRQAAWDKQAAKRRAELLKRAEKQRKALAKRTAEQKAKLETAKLETAKVPALLDQVTTQAAKFGHDVAERASAVGQELAHQAEGAAKDARKRALALSGSASSTVGAGTTGTTGS
jgi:uncharacterized membrane protein YphA (DoxX/SURF4 family)